MLFAADWDEGIRGTAFPEQVLPELTGIGSLGEIDLAEYERAVAAATDSDDSVSATPDASLETGSTTANQSPNSVNPRNVDGDVAAVNKTSSPSADEPLAETSSNAPLQVERVVWKSLIPVIGLALIVAIAGGLLLRS